MTAKCFSKQSKKMVNKSAQTRARDRGDLCLSSPLSHRFIWGQLYFGSLWRPGRPLVNLSILPALVTSTLRSTVSNTFYQYTAVQIATAVLATSTPQYRKHQQYLLPVHSNTNRISSTCYLYTHSNTYRIRSTCYQYTTVQLVSALFATSTPQYRQHLQYLLPEHRSSDSIRSNCYQSPQYS